MGPLTTKLDGGSILIQASEQTYAQKDFSASTLNSSLGETGAEAKGNVTIQSFTGETGHHALLKYAGIDLAEGTVTFTTNKAAADVTDPQTGKSTLASSSTLILGQAKNGQTPATAVKLVVDANADGVLEATTVTLTNVDFANAGKLTISGATTFDTAYNGKAEGNTGKLIIAGTSTFNEDFQGGKVYVGATPSADVLKANDQVFTDAVTVKQDVVFAADELKLVDKTLTNEGKLVVTKASVTSATQQSLGGKNTFGDLTVGSDAAAGDLTITGLLTADSVTVAGKDGSNKGAFAFSSTNEDESAIQKLTVQANGSATVTAGDLTVSALDIQKGGAVSVTGGELSLDTLTIAQDSSNNPTGTFTLTSGDLSTSAANIYTLKKTADGTLDLVASGANKGAVQATLNKGLTLNGGNVWVSDETEWSAADYANLKTTMGSATLFFANGTFVSKDENGKTTGLGTLANLLTTGSTGTTGTLGEAYAAKSEIAAEHGTTTPHWDNLDKRVTLGSLTAVATAEDAKAMTSASFNGTGVLVLPELPIKSYTRS